MFLQFYQQIHLQMDAIKKLPEATSQICVDINMWGSTTNSTDAGPVCSSFYWSLQPQCSGSYFQKIPLSQVGKRWPKPHAHDLRATEEYSLLLSLEV